MNKKNILTYGLQENQMETLVREFSSECINDVTGCFSDLLAIPAAAIVVNSDALDSDERRAFDEVFEHDFDTCISVLGTWENMSFLHVEEPDSQKMNETICAIKERLCIPDEFVKAKKRQESIISTINTVIDSDPDASFRSQIGHVNSTCISYELLTKIMEHLADLKPIEKVPYRIEINSVLKAFMIAQGLLNIDELEFVDEPDIGCDRKWIASQAESFSKHYENTVMKNGPVYRPIIEKISSWIKYEENKPKTEYKNDVENHDSYRAENDLDCILRCGDLRADTIFSLWRPLRFALVKVSGYEKIKQVTGMNLEKSVPFYRALIRDAHLRKLLPVKDETTRLLSTLFYYGQRIENTMLLPKRWLQSRGNPPYHDYMPYFLSECFEGGHFHKAFGSNEKVCEWVSNENLTCFFDGPVCKDNIIDLAGTGDIKNGLPEDLNILLTNYIDILKKRTIKLNHAYFAQQCWKS